MWASLPQARLIWSDAPDDDVLLEHLLEVAHEVCEIYAPDLVDGEAIPARYVEANVLQAREVWNAAKREGDVIGYGDYAVMARDLSSTVKSLLRPRSGYRRLG